MYRAPDGSAPENISNDLEKTQDGAIPHSPISVSEAAIKADVPPASMGMYGRRLIRAGLFLLTFVIAAEVTGWEVDRFLAVGAQFLPILVLAVLAYGGLRNTTARVAAYIWLALLGSLALVVALAYTLFAFVTDFSLLRGLASSPTLLRELRYEEVLKPGAQQALLWALLLLTGVALISIAMLFRATRVAMSRFMRIDPDNFVHKIALCFLSLALFSPFVPLLVLGGRPPLLELLASGNLGNLDLSVRPQDLVYQLVWMVPATLVAVGWLTNRRLAETLLRLGVVRPTLPQVGLGVGVALAMAAISMFLLDPGLRALWQAMGWPVTDTATFGRLLGNLLTPLGALLIGITAGIGEEMAVRGVLQPRIGLVLSNLVFTAFHAYQYGPDALLSVFIVGTGLGVVRHYTNTTTSAITHAVYNFTLVMTDVVMRG